jgi:hypothetical protein
MHCSRTSRILILSQRGWRHQVANSLLYDFEDSICDFDDVDLVTLTHPTGLAGKIYRLGKRLTGSDPFARFITPFFSEFSLEKEYDLLFVIVDNPWQILSINALRNWKKHCKRVVCLITEIWEKMFENRKLLHEPLQYCDHFFATCSQSIAKFVQLSGRPCTHLSPSVNTVQSSPYPFFPSRNIDITYIGRRSPITHGALLEMTKNKNFFYYYDTVKDFSVIDAKEHRVLLTNILKRSRYFIANYARIDRPEEIGGQQEPSFRFVEGAAAGAVMLGKPPANEVFARDFDWPDAVIPMEFDAPHIGEIIADLDTQPERLAKIRRENVVNSLLRHDYVYRWRTILETVGLPATPAMLSREHHLQRLAHSLTQESCHSDARI